MNTLAKAIAISSVLAIASMILLAQPRREPTVPVVRPPTTTTGPVTPVVTPAGTWTYGTVNAAPVPPDAQLRTVFVAGDWLVVHAQNGSWRVVKPVPCHPNVSSDPKCDAFFINEADVWNSVGFCARRLR